MIRERPKYQKGDVVEIIKCGHPIWEEVDGDLRVKDLRPELVGKKAVVISCLDVQNRISYGLDVNDFGYISWFDPWQLKKIEPQFKEI